MQCEKLRSHMKEAERLSEANCEYEDRLASRRLGPARIQRVPPGTWEAFQRQRIARPGGSAEQFKHPFLTNKTDFVEQLPKPVS